MSWSCIPPGPRSLAEAVCSAFERQTSIRVRLHVAPTGELMAKLMAEEYHPRADVVVLASPTAAELLRERDMLSPLPGELAAREEWSNPWYAGTAASAVGIALRAEDADGLREWADFFNGKYSGRLLMPSPAQSGTSCEFILCFQQIHGENFWKELGEAKRNGLQVSGPNSQALTGLIFGSHDAVLAAADYLVFKQIAKGEPLAMHFPKSGSPMIPRPIAILKGAANPGAAEAFVRFYLSRQSQERVAAEHLIPADIDVPLSAIRRQAKGISPLMYEAESALRQQRAALRRFQSEVERGR